jgi:ADP-heptose:LPS heptosyltransferase/GT2 family glycosyltransferase
MKIMGRRNTSRPKQPGPGAKHAGTHGATSILFQQYDLLSGSSLFDARFYVDANPDIADLNLDPLTHYLEIGCHERRDPSPHFKTSYYLRQCKTQGEAPANPLLHYLTVGAARGLNPSPAPAGRRMNASAARAAHGIAAPGARSAHQKASERHLYVDVPLIIQGAANSKVHGGLSIAGWTLARSGIDEVYISVDGLRAAVAYLGIRRPDVASEYSTWEGAMQSGFAAHVPPRALKRGRRLITVTARDRAGVSMVREFSVDVEELSDQSGPGSLRRKITQSEVELHLALLDTLKWRPRFTVWQALTPKDDALTGVRRTLHSLSRQAYPDWRLYLQRSQPKRKPAHSAKSLLARCVEGFEHHAQRIRIADQAAAGWPAQGEAPPADAEFILRLAPGDELGCDALLEFALASGFAREADLLYSDERRADPVDGRATAFFKPRWSPDLLLSTNYIGRAWCAKSELVTRAGIDLGDPAHGDYDIALRLSEAARSISHVPKLLIERSENRLDTPERERRALSEALRRRKTPGSVMPGCVPHYYRVKRPRSSRDLVSIVLPTCAAGGLVGTCIESLRDRTAYRNFEIVAADNIGPDAGRWKKWLRKHADVVVDIKGPFNWSRFNNLAAARANGSLLLFLNDDVEIIEPDWLDAMLEHIQRPEVGVVGPQLLYPDRSVQHAGVALDGIGRGRHAFRHLREDDPGYFGLALSQRNVISVTGACLMTRRDTFERLGRFEEAHAVINGDLDYCLRSWSDGLLNIFTPYSRLIHHELASRSRLKEHYDEGLFKSRWQRTIVQGDPYFNPNLSLDHDQVEVEREPVEEIHAAQPLFAAESVRRILVVKLDHIGDAITALPAVRRLKRLFPSARLTVLAGRGTRPIWSSESCVDETLEFDFFHVRSGRGTVEVDEAHMRMLENQLVRKNFDLAIDLRKQPDTRHFLQKSGARVTAGFDHHGRFPWLDVAIEWDEDVPLRAKRAHVSSDLSMLIDTVAARCEEAPAATAAAPGPGLAEAALRALFSLPLVCVHPSAGSEMRQWPLEKFSELIGLLLAEGTVNVAVIGGPDERDAARTVLQGVSRSNRTFNLAGKTSLADLPKILSRAALFVGNNSGPQHLAASLGVCTVGIHSGVVDAHEWGPAGRRALAIRRQMSCSPCFIEKARDCPRALACLSGLDSRDVFSRCMRMLRLAIGA